MSVVRHELAPGDEPVLLGDVLENLYVIIYAGWNFVALIPVAFSILLEFLLENTIHT